MPETLIYPNGIDAETGEPLLPPLPVEVVAAMARGQAIAKENLDELHRRHPPPQPQTSSRPCAKRWNTWRLRWGC